MRLRTLLIFDVGYCEKIVLELVSVLVDLRVLKAHHIRQKQEERGGEDHKDFEEVYCRIAPFQAM